MFPDSMAMVQRGGRLCLAGFLDRLALIKDFNPLLEVASGVHFSFLKSAVLHQSCQDESSKGL